MNIITLDRKQYYINKDEFPLYDHPEYKTLIIRPQIGIYDREVGLIKYLSESYNELGFNIVLLNVGLKNGGYVAINATNLNYISTFVYIDDNINKSHIDNLNGNIKIYHREKSIKIIDNDSTLITTLNNLNIKKTILILRSDNKTTLKNVYSKIEKILTSFINYNLVYDELDVDQKNKIVRSGFMIYELENYLTLNNNNCNNILKIIFPLNELSNFKQIFHYYISDPNKNILNYDNLIHICIMVKNGGVTFEEVLTKNLPFIDEWTILDTGSTDNTIEIAKRVLKDKKGNLYQEPFINFKDSRNRCLDLAGKNCKFLVMLDDTYYLTKNVRSFLTLARSDEFADSYNVGIMGTEKDSHLYSSNRISKAERNLRYMFKIHEVLQQNNNVTVELPYHEVIIIDVLH